MNQLYVYKLYYKIITIEMNIFRNVLPTPFSYIEIYYYFKPFLELLKICNTNTTDAYQ